MSNKFLNLNKACSENWDTMKPNEMGNFCERCSKSVIDFTQLNQYEISKKLKQANGNICARITQKQLDLPLIDLEIQNSFSLPYAHIAAGIMMSTALVSAQPAQSRVSIQTEIVQTSLLPTQSKNNPEPKANPAKPINFTTLNGRVNAPDGLPVHHAKVTFVSVRKLIDAYTAADGSFVLKIPSDLIDNDNVIRVSYEEVKKETDATRRNFSYMTADHILTRQHLDTVYQVTAKRQLYYLGGISSYSKIEQNPIVISNGTQINYNDFTKAQQGKNGRLNLENKDLYYFSSDAATAIYGKKAKYGLYILTDKPVK